MTYHEALEFFEKYGEGLPSGLISAESTKEQLELAVEYIVLEFTSQAIAAKKAILNRSRESAMSQISDS